MTYITSTHIMHLQKSHTLPEGSLTDLAIQRNIKVRLIPTRKHTEKLSEVYLKKHHT